MNVPALWFGLSAPVSRKAYALSGLALMALKMARTQYPGAYTRISEDACWRDTTLTVWGRAWLFIEVTKDISSLTINGAAIEALVKDPDLLAEIELLPTASGCP